jgi:5-formyltetrahydrofolate cyclo-ligase
MQPPAKAELRRQLKQTRLELGADERVFKSNAIVAQLTQLMDWSTTQSLHFFEPIQQLNEVDIRGFITELEDKYPDLQLCTSRLIGDTWELVSIRSDQPPAKFNVIIVPMLGFDPKTLHRIGYGGGYYDRFLATQPQAQKIGVCFEQGKTTNLPAQPHDIPLDIIVTEDVLIA